MNTKPRRHTDQAGLTLTSGGPAHVLFDGRLLDPATQAEANTIKRVFKPEDHKINKSTASSRAAGAARPGDDRPPMTPPRVAGVSLAPLPDAELLCELVSNATVSTTHTIGGAATTSSSTATTQVSKERKRPSPLKVAGHGGAPIIPIRAAVHPHTDSHGPVLAKSESMAKQQPHDCPKLVAEGRSLARAPTLGSNPASSGAEPGNHDKTSNITIYHEIYEADSLCGTPPALTIEAVTREFDFKYPLGPLTPSPLSPSLLTICGDLDAAASPRAMWNLDTTALPDLTVCTSPTPV